MSHSRNPYDSAGTLLIVDDHREMRGALRALLEGAFPGLVIREAADAASARRLIAEHAPRVVIMDIQLPDGNGLALTAELRSEYPRIRVIVVTLRDEPLYMERARTAGAFAYIVKERICPQLPDAVRRALEGREAS